MTITAITCTGDRQESFSLLEKYLVRQTRKPDEWIVICDGQEPTKCTLGQTLIYRPAMAGKGSLAKKLRLVFTEHFLNTDAVTWLEDDEHYADDWIEWGVGQLEKNDIAGEGRAWCCNVAERWFMELNDIRQASLCATFVGSKMFPTIRSLLRGNDDPFLDERLWRMARNGGFRMMIDDPLVNKRRRIISLKGVPGRKGYGIGHTRPTDRKTIDDPNLDALAEKIGKEDAAHYLPFFTPASLSAGLQKQTVEVHILCRNESRILPYALRHYKTFASKITLHDLGSTDGCIEIARKEGAEVVHHDTKGKFDDGLNMRIKSSCWNGTEADWVIVCDTDELAFFPNGVQETLSEYSRMNLSVIRAHGFEMFSELFPTGSGQIYDEITLGTFAPDYYCKPLLFSAKRCLSVNFSPGAHDCRTMLKDRTQLPNPQSAANPPYYLLHFHHIGPLQEIADRMNAARARFSEANKKNRWGPTVDGMTYAKDRRAFILSKLKQVIPAAKITSSPLSPITAKPERVVA